jgi:hypothetical protein
MLLDQLRDQLLDQQKPNGAWATSATLPADDLQATAHALQTLAISDRPSLRSRQAERRAGNFLLRAQATNGGWADPSKIEVPLVDADIMLGLALSRAAIGVDELVPGLPSFATPPAAGAAARAPSWVSPLH